MSKTTELLTTAIAYYTKQRLEVKAEIDNPNTPQWANMCAKLRYYDLTKVLGDLQEIAASINNQMTIPVEILCSWEQHYKRGDYKAICKLINDNNVLKVSPRQLVNYIHNCFMPEDVLRVFSQYYLSKGK